MRSTSPPSLRFLALVIAAVAWPAVSANASGDENGDQRTPPARVTVHQSDAKQLRLSAEFFGLDAEVIKRAEGEFVRLDWSEATTAGEVGAPAIPVLRRMFVAPPGATVSVTATVPAPEMQSVDDYRAGARLWPVQAPIPKVPGARANAAFVLNAAAYARDSLTPTERAVVEEMGIARRQRLMLLEIRPVAYNPADGSLAFHTRVDVTVTFGGGGPLATEAPSGLEGTVLNPELLPGGGGDEKAGKNYLIVTPPVFETDIARLATFKESLGYDVTTYVTSPGEAPSTIKGYIVMLYGDPATAPDYVLLVGDTNLIGYWVGGGTGSPDTDLNYVCMDGATDWMPDIAVGRFPARDSTQLNHLIDKTIAFESGTFSDSSYTSRAVFMASEDNYTVSEGTHNYCVSTHMEPNGIESLKLYSHTYNATTQQAREAYSGGRLFGIYSGHGSTTSWADGPPMSQSDVRGLTNDGMLSWVNSFACLTGQFTITECFTETWVLAPYGAVTAWGSSVNSYWTEDDVLQCVLFDCLYYDYEREAGPLYNLTKIVYSQSMGTGSTTRRYFEMYNLMGDPSLAIPDPEAALRASPSGALVAEGPEGGPLAPLSKTYEVRNVADYAIELEVVADQSWITLSGFTGGVLAPDELADVTVELDAAALATMPVGMHTGSVSFTNLTDHVGDGVREVRVEIGRYVFHASDVPLPIEDYEERTSYLDVETDVTIADLDVDLDLSHTYIGDLIVELRSPEGTMVTLHNRSGGSTDDLVLRYDDEGTPPEGPSALADFDGESARGTWRLTISDNAGWDTGSLNAWSLRIMPTAAPALLGDFNADGCVDNQDLGELLSHYLARTGDATYLAACDIAPNGEPDGVINNVDLGALLANYLRCE